MLANFRSVSCITLLMLMIACSVHGQAVQEQQEQGQAVQEQKTQGQGTIADYQRANSLHQKFAGLVTHDRLDPHWVSDAEFWYASNLGKGTTEFIWVDAEQGERLLAFDHQAVATALTDELDKTYTPEQLPVTQIVALRDDESGSRIGVALKAAEHWWQVTANEAGDPLVELLDKAPAAAERSSRSDRLGRGRSGGRRRGNRGRSSAWPQPKSPDGKWQVEALNGKLVLVQIDGQLEDPVKDPAKDPTRIEKHQLTDSPTGKADNGEMNGDSDNKQGEPIRVYWSPDSQHFVYMEEVLGTDRQVTLVESSPKDQLQPKVHKFRYLKPGDDVFWHRPLLFAIDEGGAIEVDETLFSNPYSLSQPTWRADSKAFSMRYNQRGHQTLRMIEVDAATGKTRSLIEETSDTFIDYSGKNFFREVKATASESPAIEAIWMSERDGWNHLYLYDLDKGELKHQVTRGQWVVRSVDHVDVERRQIWFQASGVYAGQDPYYVHACRVDFSGENFTILTEGDGDHQLSYSPGHRYLIDRYSRVDLPMVAELRDAQTGKLICELEKADASALIAAGWRAPERFVAKGRDGKTDIYGIICRPTNFDPTKKYPVIEEHYAGPHSAHCPKRFRTLQTSQSRAELGFIIVQLDGMGTSHRGKAFHDVCWKNLVDAGFPDRIEWLKAAAQHEPAMDITRVGIRGTSAGAQTSLAAVLHHSDFYKAAVSNCGCHDNRMDKIWWNEAWMGWPIGPHYEEQSNVTNAHKLGGKLLLIVGELDRNVPPTSTYQVVNALIKADKDFDFLMVPGTGHGAGSPYTTRKTWDFFVRHLQGVEPRSN